MKSSDILGLSDLRTKTVKVKEWDCDLTIRELDLENGVKLFSMVSERDGEFVVDAEQIASVVAWGVIDENGDRLFSDDEIPALMKKARDPLMFLYTEITSISVEDAEKN